MNAKIFKRTVNELEAVEKLRIKIGNMTYGSMIEQTLVSSPYINEIMRLRREKDTDKKLTAKLIKKAILEAGLTEDKFEHRFVAAKKEDIFYSKLIEAEKEGAKMLQRDLAQIPLYTGYLANVKGLGVLTSAKILAIVGDMQRFPMPSSLQSYCGLGDIEKSKKQNDVQCNYNPKAKSLLLGVIGENFLKQNSQYRVVYDERTKKTRLLHPDWWNLNADGSKNTGKNMNPKHGYRDGIRVMMKRFLCEFWIAGYAAKGLEAPRCPYILEFPQHHAESQILSFRTENSHIAVEIQSPSPSFSVLKHLGNREITKPKAKLNPTLQCEPS